jgi:hypothetical protein
MQTHNNLMQVHHKIRSHRVAILSLAMLNLIFALFAAAPLSVPLAQALDDRPAAAEVADSADDGPRSELLEDHPEISALAVESLGIALVLWGALSWIAAGGLLSDEHFLLGCARHWRRMLAVGAVGLPLRLLALAGPLLAWPILESAHDFAAVLLGAAAGLLVGGGLWCVVTVTLDRARGVALLRPDLKPWQAIRQGMRFSRRRFANTVLLATVSGLGFAAVTGAQLVATHWLPPSLVGSVLAFAAMALGSLGRAWFSAWVLLAANQ